MTWRSYIHYIIATTIVTFLIARGDLLIPFVPASASFRSWLTLGFGLALATFHIFISARLSFHSFSLKDRLMIGGLLPLSVLTSFAALYQQQGVFCKSTNATTKNFFRCLEVSLGNFIGHMVPDCQATGYGEHVAVVEPYVGWGSLLIAASFVALFVKYRRRSQ